ncbi:hypothetical protein AAG747_07890 [Rapidithrix thailandica]|uniref:Uncharacterized protein n=1 Tax=Rapidithrix thailandica TaxID=413964 RepID=A0AAW9RXU8_9BACT
MKDTPLPFVFVAGLLIYLSTRKRSSPKVPGAPVSKGFPLRQGSTGPLVRQLQAALLQQGGSAAALLRASGGADGTFGRGTAKALVRAGYPTVVDRSTFERLINRPEPEKPAGLPQYVYAKNRYGASVYKKVNSFSLPLIGETYLGALPIVKVEDQTYLGKATGKTKGDYREVEAVLNERPVRFWVDSDETKVFSGSLPEFLAFQKTYLKHKKPEHIQRILNAFS